MASISASTTITPYLVFLVCIVTLGPLQFGYHLAELNAPEAVITCKQDHILSLAKLPQCIPMDATVFGLVSSSYTLGGLLGALAAGPLSTKYGRLLVLRMTTVFFIFGPVAETLASAPPLFVVGRLVSGIGAGASLVVGPIYVSEISPSNSRGLFGAFTQVMANVGILMTQGLGYFLSKNSLWRVILAIAGFVGVIQLIGLLFVVESPLWLADNQQPAKAKKILQRIRGPGADVSEEVKTWAASKPSGRTDATLTATEEEESLLANSPRTMPPAKVPVTMFDALLNPVYRPAIISVIAVMLTQQFTGINSIIMYSVSLLSTILPTTAALLTVLVSCLNLVMTVVCAPLSDKLGRKTCILLSIAGMGSMSMLLAIGIASSLKVLSAVATLLFVASFAVGLGPVPFILASELVGPEAVGATQGWALATSWIATFIVAQFFPSLNKSMGGQGQIYWLFTAMAVILGSFIAWWVPETKGKRSMNEVWRRAERTSD